MAEVGEARSGEEVLKLRFEFFKHMTTVSTASTAAVIAVYGLSEKVLRGAVEKGDQVFLYIPGFAIGGFFLSLLLALWGLYLVAKAQHTGENSAAISRMSSLSAATFILGVGISAVTAALIIAGPKRAAVPSLIVLASVLITYLGVRQSSEAREGAQALAAASPAEPTTEPDSDAGESYQGYI